MMFDMSIPPKPSEAFDWVQAAAGPALVCRPLEPFAAHLFTTRAVAARLARPPERRPTRGRRSREAMGVEPSRLVASSQVHGADVVDRAATLRRARRRRPTSSSPTIRAGAGRPGRRLRAAADRRPARRGAVAAAHAGWRGLAARVPGSGRRARSAASSAAVPSDLIAAIGPSIGAAATRSARTCGRSSQGRVRRASSSTDGFCRLRSRRRRNPSMAWLSRRRAGRTTGSSTAGRRRATS